VEVYRFGQSLGERLSPLLTLFSVVSSRAFRDAPHVRIKCRNPNQCLPNFLKYATFSPPPNLNTRISLVENNWYAQCLGWIFSPISTFFSLVSTLEFRDAPHPHFRCRDPNQWLPNFLKMLVLALLQICNVYFTCGSLSIWTVFGWEILAPINILYSRKFSRVSRCTTLAF